MWHFEVVHENHFLKYETEAKQLEFLKFYMKKIKKIECDLYGNFWLVGEINVTFLVELSKCSTRQHTWKVHPCLGPQSQLLAIVRGTHGGTPPWVILFTVPMVGTRLHSQSGTHSKFVSNVKAGEATPHTRRVWEGFLQDELFGESRMALRVEPKITETSGEKY